MTKKVFFKPFVTASIILASCALLFSSCRKNKDDVNLPDAAIVTFVHASPKAPRLDIGLDDNRLGLNNFTYTSYWNNQRAYTGNRTLKVFRYGESSAFYTKDVTFDVDKHYSVFLADSGSKMEAVVLQNQSRSTTNDSTRVKFANMCPDVPAMDFYIKGEATPVATNVAYKSAADFISVKAGYDIIFEVRASGTSTVLAPSLPVRFAGGNIYTIYASGFKGLATAEGRVTVSSIRHTQPVYWY